MQGMLPVTEKGEIHLACKNGFMPEDKQKTTFQGFGYALAHLFAAISIFSVLVNLSPSKGRGRKIDQ
ncbi:hypothetical protein [Varibaculum cambriense]|uniref:hypothetical protein n=1 Tax=Varibaculum cambriense TaxID=184870 RepID=UPI002907328F|nr:hypothetical protein [Varibaculum cambriense]MDU5541451.1 hypothetical protein [Varibaculum cambriense]